MTAQNHPATVKTKAKCEAVKIHGPNSPDVLSGRVPLGFREPIQMDEPEQVVELTYDQYVTYFGKEAAEEVFRRAAETGDENG